MSPQDLVRAEGTAQYRLLQNEFEVGRVLQVEDRAAASASLDELLPLRLVRGGVPAPDESACILLGLEKPIDREVVRATNVYFITFLLVFATSVFIISLEGHDLITNFTAVAATINNIGPGLSQVGPAANFNFFSHFSKYVLMFDMLAGRLEFFPLLILLHPTVWKDFATRKKKRTTL